MKVIYCSLVNCAAPRSWCGVFDAVRTAHDIFDGEPLLKLVKPTPPVIMVTCTCSTGAP